MPLTFQLTVNPVASPRVAPTRDVRKLAEQMGNPNHQGAIAITTPLVRSELNRLNFTTSSFAGFTTLAFNTGTLPLTLTQTVHLADVLAPGARTIWQRHELEHVGDNEQLFRTALEPALRADPEFREILLNPTPTPGHGQYDRSEFAAVQARIHAAIQRVWRALTLTAVRRRDTAREYARVWQEIRTTCGPAADLSRPTPAPAHR